MCFPPLLCGPNRPPREKETRKRAGSGFFFFFFFFTMKLPPLSTKKNFFLQPPRQARGAQKPRKKNGPLFRRGKRLGFLPKKVRPRQAPFFFPAQAKRGKQTIHRNRRWVNIWGKFCPPAKAKEGRGNLFLFFQNRPTKKTGGKRREKKRKEEIFRPFFFAFAGESKP